MYLIQYISNIIATSNQYKMTDEITYSSFVTYLKKPTESYSHHTTQFGSVTFQMLSLQCDYCIRGKKNSLKN